jgi:pyridoxal phosphate phosphatase PHOSPHO2
MLHHIQLQVLLERFTYRSLADQDTDRWVLEVLAPDLRRKMKDLKDDIQWTDLV